MTRESRGGRPRNEGLHQAILKTAFDFVLEVGFRAVSVESIAAKVGAGKTTILSALAKPGGRGHGCLHNGGCTPPRIPILNLSVLR